MAKGWKLEPGRHALAAKGVETGRKTRCGLALHKVRQDTQRSPKIGEIYTKNGKQYKVDEVHSGFVWVYDEKGTLLKIPMQDFMALFDVKKGVPTGRKFASPAGAASLTPKEKLTMGELNKELQGFYGTEHYHQGYMGTMLTDGVAYVAERAGASWMFSDAAVIARMKLKGEGFIVAKVKVTDDSKAVITYEDGDEHKLFSQKYEYTDFPKGEFKFYIIDNVMLLPSEY